MRMVYGHERFYLTSYSVKGIKTFDKLITLSFCDKKGYELVWFCKDIEQVYLKRKVKDKDKKDETARFKAKKLIMSVDTYKLQVEQYKPGCSNIMGMIDKYLDRK